MIITNFYLYLIQLWCQFFQNFVYGDVVYAQTWEVLALKNCIEPPQLRQVSFNFIIKPETNLVCPQLANVICDNHNK